MNTIITHFNTFIAMHWTSYIKWAITRSDNSLTSEQAAEVVSNMPGLNISYEDALEFGDSYIESLQSAMEV